MRTSPTVPRRLVLAGGSGFLGRALTRHWSKNGHEVVVLSRQPTPATNPSVRFVAWDERPDGAWAQELEGADALVNLAGHSVDCRPTARNREQILRSRVESVRRLGQACARCTRPPAVWIQASALAWYGDHADGWLDESSPSGTGFMAQTAQQWEAALNDALPPACRAVILRIGIVLGADGGAAPKLVRLARWGLGGSAGHGRQFVSWIHLDDFVRLADEAWLSPRFSGAYNACTPQPVTNREFMRALRTAVRRPWTPPAPDLAVRLGAWLMGTDPGLVLTGRRCRSSRLPATGFQFQFPEIDAAWQAVVAHGNRH